MPSEPSDPLLAIAEELYGLPPAEFTGTRNQWAKQTKADGDAELAATVSALRKPAVAAWVVNMLMRHQGDQMTQVLDLGASLRQAQTDLDGDALRELTRQRRQLTTAVTQQGRELARDLGQRLTTSVADQVQDTLHAAMVDEQAAAAVRSGLLVTALRSTGVGATRTADGAADAVAVPAAIGLTARARRAPPAAKPSLRVVRGAGAPDAPEPDPAAVESEAARRRSREQAERDERVAAAQRAVDEQRETADTARTKAQKADKKVRRLQARTLQAAEQLEEVQRRVAELEHELESLDEQVTTAEERKDKADARYAEAQQGLEDARARLADER